ncbi:MAG: PEP-CTERM sorting domain-containing protein [Pirellulales bacterium]
MDSPRGEIDSLGHKRVCRRWQVRAVGSVVAIGLLLLITLAAPLRVSADPAHFWISTSNIFSPAPEAPAIDGVRDSVRYLHIWAQPPPGKRLQNFSLNLVADPAVVSFVNSSIVVYNPEIDGKKRFEFVYDASEGLTATGSSQFPPYQIRGMQGFSIRGVVPFVYGGITYAGIGGTTCDNDPYCAMTANGPAWLLASVASRAITDSGSAQYFLRIGANGMNYAGESTSQTSVVFGTDSEPQYNASTDREKTLPNDTTADFVLNARPQAEVIDTHWSGGDGQWNQIAGGGAPSWLHNAYLDVDAGVVTVTGSQQANSTTINSGRLHISDNSSLASDTVVSPGGAISGEGWVGSNLMLDGTLAIASAQPLRVAGSANVAGGTIGLLDSYWQPSNTTATVTVLEAVGGIQGTLIPPLDRQLRPGYFLELITYLPQSITAQLRSESVNLPGDFNGDGRVDAADYVVWRKNNGTETEFNTWRAHFGESLSVGLPGDFNGDGSVDAADYVVWRKNNGTPAEFNTWRANFGRTSGDAAGGSPSAGVPEPASLLILFIGVCLFWFARKRGRLLPRQPRACGSRPHLRSVPLNTPRQRNLHRLNSVRYFIAAAVLAVLWWLLGDSCRAAIITTGNVTPDPATTTLSNDLYVGYVDDGTMTVDGGSLVQSRKGTVGYLFDVSASVVVDGNNSAWINATELRVGDFGSGTLDITNGGTVANTLGTVGNFSGSTGMVTVDGTGSAWLNSSDLRVGNTGNGTLIVSGSGAVINRWGYIGDDSGSSGTVTVDGAGSTWTNMDHLRIGNSGDGELNITRGAIVSNRDGIIGDDSGSTGVVTVDGAVSTWTNDSILRVGESGNGTLNITGGGVVLSNGESAIGSWLGSEGVVTISGVGSTWTNNSSLRVGYAGSGTLNIQGGGSASNDSSVVIANLAGSTGAVTVDGAGSTWTNSSRLTVGWGGSGTLNITGGGVVSNTDGYVAEAAGSAGNVTVDGAGSMWTNTVQLQVGVLGSGILTITGGGDVSNTTGFIGVSTGSTGSVTVDGAGSTWTNNELQVGRYGSGTLAITGGGAVSSNTSSYIGDKTGSTGLVTVDGAGSNWTTSSSIWIGGGGNGNLDIIAGGAVSSSKGIIGDKAGSTGLVTVDGAGSMWMTSSSIWIGDEGSGTLNITSGGTVVNAAGWIGYFSGSTGVVTVDGTGSTWTNSSVLDVGKGGNGTLNITGGGAVSNTSGFIGSKTGSTGMATVDGAGSTWTNSQQLQVGVDGNGTLSITSGGAVSSNGGFIGTNSGSTGLVMVDGAGSMWTNSLFLVVGNVGNGTLNITGGGAVSSRSGIIADEAGSAGLATVNGVGSTWTNSRTLTVANFGSGTLNITDGGTVTSSDGFIASEAGSTGLVTVAGTDSTWTNNSFLVVGNGGSGTLNVTGGGAVSNDRGHIGDNLGSAGVVTVDGAGSTWTSSYSINVGHEGSGTLNITGGGAVSGGYGVIGDHSSATGVVTVDGADTMWTNSSYLKVGHEGSGTLNITSGGVVIVGGDTFVSSVLGSSGTIVFDNGTLTTGGLLAVFDDLTGTGTVNTHGLVSDVDLVFDATNGLNRTFNLNSLPGQNVTVHLDVDGTGSMGAGYRASGTMSISDGVVVASTDGFIGYASDSTGVVTVDGAGSMWSNSNDLTVGNSGNGTLNITRGGVVIVGGDMFVSSVLGSSGTIVFDNGTLTTGGLLAVFDDLTGTGTVNTHGLVSDVDLVFDATNGLNRTFNLNSLPGQNVTVHLDVDGTGSMGAGYRASGTMSISDGVVVASTDGFIGYASDSTGVVTVDGAGSMWSNSNDLTVGRSGSGTLNITGGGAVSSSDGFIANDSGSTGVVTVDGAGSNWTNSSILTVGKDGIGQLDIVGGGAVGSGEGIIGDYSGHSDDPNSMGLVTVDGTGSIWTNNSSLTIGRRSSGTLNITGGGTVSTRDGTIGDAIGSNGVVTVDGAGSMWTNTTELIIGRAGSGTLNITGGGEVSNSDGFIGTFFGFTGVVTVDGPGSTWTNSSQLQVGENGSGTLNITSGGVVSSRDGIIGNAPGATGVVTVDGAGSMWTNSSDLTVGNINSSSGILSITGGGLVTSSNGYIARDVASLGSVTVSGAGSRWSLSDSLYVGDREIIGGEGTLTLDGGTVEAAHNVNIGQTGKVRGSGTIVGNVINAGRVAPGFSPGIIYIMGDYTQDADGVLEIEVGGLDNSDPMNPQFDQLIVTGTATLGGRTEFPVINGFVPQLNDEITYITAANVLGKPNALLSPNLEQANPNIGFQVIKNDTDVRLRFVEKGALQFVDNSGGAVDPTDWHEPANWDLNRVPVSSDVISLDRSQTGDVQRIEVKNDDAFTHQFTLEDQSSPIELAIINGRTLSSAVGALTIGNNAKVELNDGTLVSSAVRLENGGQLAGNGTIGANLMVGVTEGQMEQATVSPGFAVGHLDVEGDYQQGDSGTLEVDVEGTVGGQFDTVDVTGDVQLGGTLLFDASGLGSGTSGATVEILTSNTLTGMFDHVDTVGSGEFYIRPIYDDGAGGGGASVSGEVCDLGDMDCDGIIVNDNDDIQALAMALRDIEAYFEEYQVYTIAGADLDGWYPGATEFGNDRLDFDDIDDFVRLHSGGGSGAAMFQKVLAAIENYGTVPEPASFGSLLYGVCLLVAFNHRRRT